MTSLPVARSGKTAFELAAETAKEAGEILLDRFNSAKEIKHKGKHNIVTAVDILSEKLIVDSLSKEYPNFKILSEETRSDTELSGYSWVIDPLDGTNNYVYGIPFFCVNIALVKDQDIQLGVTYDPLRQELFHAEKGKGAYLNNLPINVSEAKSIDESLLGVDLGYNQEEGEVLLDIISRLYRQVHCIRVMGSASLGLAYIACGRMTIYIHRWLYPWDIASGLLLVKEAGGVVSDWQNSLADIYSIQLVASNHKVYQDFMKHFD